MSSEPEIISSIICPRCHAELPAGNEVCNYCGTYTDLKVPGRTSVPKAVLPATVLPEQKSIVDNPWFVIGMVFGAAMFLGIPLIWKTKAFTTNGKMLLTVLTLIYSIVIFWIFFLIMANCYETIRQSM